MLLQKAPCRSESFSKNVPNQYRQPASASKNPLMKQDTPAILHQTPKAMSIIGPLNIQSVFDSQIRITSTKGATSPFHTKYTIPVMSNPNQSI